MKGTKVNRRLVLIAFLFALIGGAGGRRPVPDGEVAGQTPRDCRLAGYRNPDHERGPGICVVGDLHSGRCACAGG